MTSRLIAGLILVGSLLMVVGCKSDDSANAGSSAASTPVTPQNAKGTDTAQAGAPKPGMIPGGAPFKSAGGKVPGGN